MFSLTEKVGVNAGWKQRAVPAICYRMILGMKPGRLEIEEVEFDNFSNKYKDLIEKLVPHMPQNLAALDAALVKCAIVYGPEKVIEFCNNAKNLIFKGKNDPAYLFHNWGFIGKKRGPRPERKSIATYSVALNLCRAFCEDRTQVHVRAARVDIFEWDENFEPILNQKRKNHQTEEVHQS